MSSEGKRPVSLVLNSSVVGRDGVMPESFLMFLWLNHGTQMSESPWVNVAFHIGVNRNVNNTGFIRGANIGSLWLSLDFKVKQSRRVPFTMYINSLLTWKCQGFNGVLGWMEMK